MGVWRLTGMCSEENGEGLSLCGQEVRDWLPFQWNAEMGRREGAESSKFPMGGKQHTQSLIILRIRVSPLELSQFPSYHTRARSLLKTRLCFPLSESCYCCHILAQSRLTLQPHGLQPTRFLCPWDFCGKSTEVSCHLLLQGIFQTEGLNLCLLLGRRILHW